jgi:DNA-binding MarR family transcriptional regulator
MHKRGVRERGAGTPEEATTGLADRLHSAAIHLLRRLRREDGAAQLRGPELSVLSVVVHGGPLRVGELAEAEQVSAPTMSRLLRRMEASELLLREVDAQDRRVVRVRATERGRKLLREGRARRVRALTRGLRTLPAAELAALAEGVTILERVLQEGRAGAEAGRPRSGEWNHRVRGATGGDEGAGTST